MHNCTQRQENYIRALYLRAGYCMPDVKGPAHAHGLIQDALNGAFHSEEMEEGSVTLIDHTGSHELVPPVGRGWVKVAR